VGSQGNFRHKGEAMNRYAYRTTGYAIKALTWLSNANIRIHYEEKIPKGTIIYAINHFTRMETVFIPYHINRITGQDIWSLADYSLFEGVMGSYLNEVGAVSTKNPDRDKLIVKSLLAGEASWIIFPEGRMVKNKKIYDKNGKKQPFIVASPEGRHAPHTGAATLALRTEFYRERIRQMVKTSPDEARRILELFKIDDAGSLVDLETYIVPVNLTYYPIRAKENIISRMAEKFLNNISERMVEEIMTEGSMLLSGVDVDLCFGNPIKVSQYMKSSTVKSDIDSLRPINFDDQIASRSMLRTSALNIMHRYMSSIYRMTTVNHDHLFASLLKHIPYHEIDESDLRRKAFLATTIDFHKKKVFRHDRLRGNQINLLTDDRYKNFDNFISLAMEKEVVHRAGGTLVKETSFAESGDFHMARITNPVAVILNEIEPLADIQDYLRNLAWQPGLRTKHRVANFLEKKALFDFEKDYANFSIAGESKPKDVGRPFLIKGKSKDVGILLIHGYMAAPLEVRALAEYLGEIGYRVCAPRLKGHGTSPEDLASRTYMEWVESVEEAYIFLRYTCKHIVVGGFSTGAGLALDICSRINDMAGVFAIAPPLKLQDFSSKFVPAVNLWNKLMDKVSLKGAQKEFVENQPENPHINYFRNPLSGIMELDRLMDSLESKLANIKVPALVVQSHGDPVVNPKGSIKIFEELGSDEKECLVVNFGRHGIINGENSHRVYRAVEDFIKRLDLGM